VPYRYHAGSRHSEIACSSWACLLNIKESIHLVNMWVTTGHSSFLHQNLSRYQKYNDTGFTDKMSHLLSLEEVSYYDICLMFNAQWFEGWKCHSYFVLYLTFVSCCCLTHCFSCTLLSRPHKHLPSFPS